jgi:hypothetical protein
MGFSMKKLLSNFPVKSVGHNVKSLGKNVKTIVHNRAVLYALCFIALYNIIMYANVKDFNSVITLILIGLITSFFSKNMIIILALAISITYLLNFHNVNVFSEGAQNMKEGADGDVESTSVKDTATEEETADESTTVSDIANSGAAEAEAATKPTDSDTRDRLSTEIKNDFSEFQKTADSISKSMTEIEPLLDKAEGFIHKFEKYTTDLEVDQKK